MRGATSFIFPRVMGSMMLHWESKEWNHYCYNLISLQFLPFHHLYILNEADFHVEKGTKLTLSRRCLYRFHSDCAFVFRRAFIIWLRTLSSKWTSSVETKGCSLIWSRLARRGASTIWISNYRFTYPVLIASWCLMLGTSSSKREIIAMNNRCMIITKQVPNHGNVINTQAFF